MQIITRQEAKAQGLKRYFTGKPCPHGHIVERQCCNGSCLTCEEARKKIYQEANRKEILARQKACYAANREEVLARQKAHYEANRDKILTRGKAHYEANREKEVARSKAYREANREKEAARKKTYRETNREKDAARGKAYREANPEKVTARTKAYYEANRNKILARQKAHNKANRDKILARQKVYLANNPQARAAHVLRARIFHAIRAASATKSARTLELLGASLEEVRAHLEAQFKLGMAWDNWSFKGWHIDHIKPCASFDLTDPEQQKACFHYTNLQPLWAEDNLRKKDRLDWVPAKA